MNNNKQFIENEILKSKAKICDYEKFIKEEEKRLLGLYGALETFQIIEKYNKTDERRYDDIANKKLNCEL